MNLNDISNGDIYSALMDIKQDIGGLKATTETHIASLTEHNRRLGALETADARSAGAAKVWGLFAGIGGSALGVAVTSWFKHHSQ